MIFKIMEISSSKEESWEFANLICDPFEDINEPLKQLR
jgi:hypothetical protein